jgi:hypothetical protein
MFVYERVADRLRDSLTSLDGRVRTLSPDGVIAE